jgi:hypothetical protein
MAHTYATVAEVNDYLTSGGSTKYAAEAAAIVALKLSLLEGVSRRIDDVCRRSAFGSGFGPRIGTNYYDGDGTNGLLLKDDLISLSAFTVASVTGGTGVSPVVSTDYFLSNVLGYTGPPWRQLILHGQGSPVQFFSGYRTIVCTGTWGYPASTVTLTATYSAIGTAGTTSVAVSAATEFSAGQTLLIDSEQMYLTSLTGTTLTVVRGVNGTTAATHAGGALAKYVYDARVHDVALRLFMRRWKARDAGADGTSGGLDMPAQQTTEGEKLIIERGLSDLVFLGQY